MLEKTCFYGVICPGTVYAYAIMTFWTTECLRLSFEVFLTMLTTRISLIGLNMQGCEFFRITITRNISRGKTIGLCFLLNNKRENVVSVRKRIHPHNL